MDGTPKPKGGLHVTPGDYLLIADGRETRAFKEARQAGAAFYAARRDEHPRLVQQETWTWSFTWGDSAEKYEQAIAMTGRTPEKATGYEHIFVKEDPAFIAGYEQARSQMPDKALPVRDLTQETTPAHDAPSTTQPQPKGIGMDSDKQPDEARNLRRFQIRGVDIGRLTFNKHSTEAGVFIDYTAMDRKGKVIEHCVAVPKDGLEYHLGPTVGLEVGKFNGREGEFKGRQLDVPAAEPQRQMDVDREAQAPAAQAPARPERAASKQAPATPEQAAPTGRQMEVNGLPVQRLAFIKKQTPDGLRYEVTAYGTGDKVLARHPALRKEELPDRLGASPAKHLLGARGRNGSLRGDQLQLSSGEPRPAQDLSPQPGQEAKEAVTQTVAQEAVAPAVAAASEAPAVTAAPATPQAQAPAPRVPLSDPGEIFQAIQRQGAENPVREMFVARTGPEKDAPVAIRLCSANELVYEGRFYTPNLEVPLGPELFREVTAPDVPQLGANGEGWKSLRVGDSWAVDMLVEEVLDRGAQQAQTVNSIERYDGPARVAQPGAAAPREAAMHQEAPVSGAARAEPAAPAQQAQDQPVGASQPLAFEDSGKATAEKRRQELLASLAQRFTINAGEYRFRSEQHRVAFVDREKTLTTDRNEPEVARAMVDLAEAKGWKTVQLKGTEPFRAAAWMEASVRGLKSVGYEPSRADLVRLQERLKDQQINRVELGQEPDAARQPPAQQQARQPVKPTELSEEARYDRAQALGVLERHLKDINTPPEKMKALLERGGKWLDEQAALGKGYPKAQVYDMNAQRQRQVHIQPQREQAAPSRAR